MYAHSQLGDDCEVLFQILVDDLAQFVVVLERLNLLDFSKGVEGVVVKVVDVADVAVGDDDIGELLHVSYAMRQSGDREICQQGALSVTLAWREGREGGSTELAALFEHSLLN